MEDKQHFLIVGQTHLINWYIPRVSNEGIELGKVAVALKFSTESSVPGAHHQITGFSHGVAHILGVLSRAVFHVIQNSLLRKHNNDAGQGK